MSVIIAEIMAFLAEYKRIMIDGDRYQFILDGLKNTFVITLGALAIGIVIGIVVAAIRTSFDKNKESMKVRGGIGYYTLALLNLISKFYLTVTRGTPVVVQLMICYFVIFALADDGIPVAIFAFGINSGAYVAEIFRAGIMSVDNGQFEAGRSLGFSYVSTMRFIVLPQAFKAVLPALANEIITMVKESSICSMLGMAELMFAAKTVASSTYITLAPYTIAALIYFCINYPASKGIEAIERRMRRGDKQ